MNKSRSARGSDAHKVHKRQVVRGEVRDGVVGAAEAGDLLRVDAVERHAADGAVAGEERDREASRAEHLHDLVDQLGVVLERDIGFEAGERALGLRRDVDREVRVLDNAVGRVAARVKNEVVERRLGDEVGDAAVARRGARAHEGLVAVEVAHRLRVEVVHEHLERVVRQHREAAREVPGRRVNRAGREEVPVVAVHRAEDVRLAAVKHGLEPRDLGVKLAVRGHLAVRLDEALARVVDAVDLGQPAGPRDLQERIDGMQQRGRAACLEDELVRVDKHAALAEHVRVEHVVRQRTHDLAVDELEQLVPVVARDGAQRRAGGVGRGPEVHLKQLLGSLEKARARVR
eukprot:Unigene1933_Nuclearia_a/m.6013 Unigene1933_Nuclearia_a/g.6013  ORF Unigene1933_Nuclearia_a/g.6013 Unigene1933_Nuclearia_a/m.6013 type:complete len:345 (+) Unigene1933_Nuclearia_a:133-1167(+)